VGRFQTITSPLSLMKYLTVSSNPSQWQKIEPIPFQVSPAKPSSPHYRFPADLIILPSSYMVISRNASMPRGTGGFTKGDRSCTYVFCKWPALSFDWYNVGRVIIDMLPDVALLEIFDSSVNENRIDAWYSIHWCSETSFPARHAA
jgi:hypothetical protein